MKSYLWWCMNSGLLVILLKIADSDKLKLFPLPATLFWQANTLVECRCRILDFVCLSFAKNKNNFALAGLKFIFLVTWVCVTVWYTVYNCIWQGLTSLISPWLPVKIVQNGPKLCKRKHVFLCWILLWGIQGIPLESWRPADSEIVMFFMLSFLNRSYYCSKLGQISRICFAKWQS